MIIVELKNGEHIDRVLKILKSKVIKTKQNQILFDRKKFTKKSVKKRTQKLKAIYIQNKRIS